MVDDAFLTLHREMTRQGPGTSEDVRWALSQLDLPDAPNVLDAACGPGADLVTLAECLPRARIEGIDQLPHLVEEARTATDRFTNVTVSTGDMAQINGFYDLIWCSGALYFLGVTEGLTLWKRALTTDGAVAFSEPVLPADAPQSAKDFWADYPAISDLDGITARVEAAGYVVQDHRLITGMAGPITTPSLAAASPACAPAPTLHWPKCSTTPPGKSPYGGRPRVISPTRSSLRAPASALSDRHGARPRHHGLRGPRAARRPRAFRRHHGCPGGCA